MTGILLGLTEDAARPAMQFLQQWPADPLAVEVKPAWEGIGRFAFRG